MCTLHSAFFFFFSDVRYVGESIECCTLENKCQELQTDIDYTPRTWRKNPSSQSHTTPSGCPLCPQARRCWLSQIILRQKGFFFGLPHLCALCPSPFPLVTPPPVPHIKDQQHHKDVHTMNLSDRVILLLQPSSSLSPFLPLSPLSPFVTVADCVMVDTRQQQLRVSVPFSSSPRAP